MESYILNDITTIDGIVNKFTELLKETGAISLQPYESAEELFSARKAEFAPGYYIIGNTFIFDHIDYNNGPVVLANNDSNLVDFKRTEVVSLDQLKIYLKKLVSDWVEKAFYEGTHFSSETTDEEQRAEIMRDIFYWNDAFDTHWTAFDPDDKVNEYWLGQYKTLEDRESLIKA